MSTILVFCSALICSTAATSLLRTLQAAEIGGLRAIVAHAKDDAAKSFYEKLGFEPSPLDAFHLMVLLKDLRKIVKS